MRPSLFFSIILLLSSSPAWPQSDSVYLYKQWYNKAEKLFNLQNPTRKTDSLAAVLYLRSTIHAIKEKDGKVAIGSLIKAATINQTYQHFTEANDLYHKAIITNQALFRDTALLYETCLYLGSVFYQQGKNDSAKFYFEKASTFITLHPRGEDFPEQARLYNSLGAIYYESANYSQAMNYFNNALQSDDAEETRVTLQSNIANCLVKLSRYDEGIKLFSALLPSAYLRRIVLHNIAHAYYKTGQYDSALKYFSKVSRQHDEVSVRMLTDLGKIYSAKGKYNESKKVLDSSLMIINMLSGTLKSTDRALNYLVRSAIADQQQQTDEAMKWCNDAFSELLIAGPLTEVNTISPVLMIEVLKQKAALLEKQYNKTKSATYLESCFRNWQQAIHVANYIRRYLDNDEAKLYFQQDKGEIYHEALRIGFKWMDKKIGQPPVNELIGVMEAYKGNILFENIQQATLKAESKIPDAIRAKEKALKQSLSYYTVKLGISGSSVLAADLQKKILAARVSLSRLQKQYEQHPEYNFYKQDTAVTDYRQRLATVMDNNTAIISFMLANQNIYAIGIAGKSFQTHVIKLTPHLKNSVSSFQTEIYQHAEGKRYEGARTSLELYKQLIEPFKKLIHTKEKVVILPDGLINYIPFEALTVSNDNRDYLLLHKKISYHYSISVLLFNHENPGKDGDSNSSLFFAPFTSDHISGLSKLPNSVNEVPGANAAKWIGDKATKKNLLEKIANSGIVHLATHAKSGNGHHGDALIYLYPADSSDETNNLYLEEIYSLDLNKTKLVILSACETAGGVNAEGEGLLSLSRAFMYAGSKGMISTLWKTEDLVAAKLMQFLYTEMEKGYTAEEALQRAKLRLLRDDAISEKYKTPNYWANFIYVGHTGKRVNHFNNLWLYLLVPAGLSIILLCIFKKKAIPPFRDSLVVEP